ncbi:uncharacterized protein LOC108906319 [Anoplophora glabripennis]|uniref:uncharacterized protein LOC108906319 n=1 Tax=Anoplophora glabripennis TaxID=217634 RepID=UPI000875350E|nr:uncharacterized protein LOC108906319 [Anoplophora glabripennis]
MKVLAALIAVCVVASLVQAELIITEEQKSKLIGHHKVCSEQVSVQDDVIEKLLEGVFSEDQSFKNYLFCLSKRIGFQNEAGEVQKEVIITKLRDSIEDPSKAEEYTEKCLVKEGKPADVVYKVVTCLQESTPNVLFA